MNAENTTTAAGESDMTLIYIKKKYSSGFEPLTLVRSVAEANAIAAIVERSQTTESIQVITVPMWPNIRSEE